MIVRWWANLISLLYLLLGLGYSLLVPVWEGPDEHAHYYYVLHILWQRRPPPIERDYEAYQPAPYYWFASAPLKLLNRIDPGLTEVYLPPDRHFENVGKPAPIYPWDADNFRVVWGVLVLRWINLLFGLLAVRLIYHALDRYYTRSDPVKIAALAFAALLPQLLHILATVSNDASAYLAGALLFWLLGRLVAHPGDARWQLLAALAALVLPVTTKMTVLPVSAAVLLVVLVQLLRAGTEPSRRALLAAGGLALFLVLALGLLAPYRLEILWKEIQWRGLTVRPGALAFPYLSRMVGQVVWSFWGKFGWLGPGLPGWLVAVPTVLSLAGGLLGLRLLFKDGPVERRFARVLWLAAGLSLLVVGKNGLNTSANQGRFLFPALGSLGLLVVAGWATVIPEKYHRLLAAAVLLIMLGLNLWAWLGVILPVYFQPLLG